MNYTTNLFYRIILVISLLCIPAIIQCSGLDRVSLYHRLKSNILDLYKRPITLLDIHAKDGYFSFNIAQEYDSTCVMMENDCIHINHLLQKYYHQNDTKNIILLKKEISIEDLERLASCEYFDVALIFNGVDHFGNEWKRTIDTLLNLGNNIIIGISDFSFNTNQQKAYLKQCGCRMWQEDIHLYDTKTSSLFWCMRQNKSLDRHHWLGKKGYSGDYLITSNFNEKTIYKYKENKTYPWIRGINLLTFKMLEGILPDKNVIKITVENMEGILHEDLMLWNMIIQGTNITPIDFFMKSGNAFDTNACISFDLGMIDQDSSTGVTQWFKNHWPHFIEKHGLDIPLNFYDYEQI